MRLDSVGERDAVEVVFTVRTSFEKEFAFVRDAVLISVRVYFQRPRA